MRLNNRLRVVDMSVGLQRPLGYATAESRACCGSLVCAQHADVCPAKPDLPDSMLTVRYIDDGLVEWHRRE